ncbi:hypothetical protein SLEP1_g34841 [Rubroshorea leprosula]|uniref:FAD-dependent oxidoreductase 2 FAD binding domain-containing protein n=1 Tax=Rubroshorea leprosula TaxID=152421 RepID=A0AAV5KLL4_9ROSI|nr:hypothetical protein SLEP1_g34841 [Rubroshorea leprosula]
METLEDIVIVGVGTAGLATALDSTGLEFQVQYWIHQRE